MKLTAEIIDKKNNPAKYLSNDAERIKVTEINDFSVELLNAGGVWRTEFFDNIVQAKEYAIRKGGDAIINECYLLRAGYYSRWTVDGQCSVPIYQENVLANLKEKIDYIPATQWLEEQRQIY